MVTGEAALDVKEACVNQKVRTVSVVSDGIVVEFDMGVSCYFPASFLVKNLTTESNQVFLNFDPSMIEHEVTSASFGANVRSTPIDATVITPVFGDGMQDRLRN